MKETPMGDLNSSHLIPQRQRAIGLKGAIESFEMFDDMGNCCSAALFGPVNKPAVAPSKCDRSGEVDGEPIFEVAFNDFNNSDLRLFRGSLGNCKLSMQLFFERKEKDGFAPMLADAPQAPIN